MVAVSVPPHPNVARALAVSDDGLTMLLPRYAGDAFTALWEADEAPAALRHSFEPMLVAIDLLEAVIHLHRHGVAHRDIKPENLMITPCGRGVLADLDFCTRARRLSVRHYAGTKRYTPPSVARRHAIHKAASAQGRRHSAAGRGSYCPFAHDRYATALTVLELLVRDAHWTEATHDGLHPEDLRPPMRKLRREYGTDLHRALDRTFLCLDDGSLEGVLDALYRVEERAVTAEL
jgi:hypothetical protein